MKELSGYKLEVIYWILIPIYCVIAIVAMVVIAIAVRLKLVKLEVE